MLKNIFKKSIILLLTIVLLISLIGCGKEEEIIEDKITTISISSKQLEPEITDEDLGIIRKEPTELMKITGYQSWEGYNFLTLKRNTEDETNLLTIQVEDNDLFKSLYAAKLVVLLEPSYASVSQDDPMYGAYARGLRSLGNKFYEFNNEEKITEEIEEVESIENEENIDNENEENIEENVNNEQVDEQSLDDVLNGGLSNTEEEQLKEKKRIELKEAIDNYMESISLNRATKLMIYALDGECLGEMTATKVDDYLASVNIETLSYAAEEGIVYLSDLLDGYEYEIPGYLMDEQGNYRYILKNDSKKPVSIHLKSSTIESDEQLFTKYLSTEKSTGWNLIENEFKFTSSDETYKISVSFKNSDSDLANSIDDVLKIEKIEKNEKTEKSVYSAIQNLTSYPVHIIADTGDKIILEPQQAIGLHKSAYTNITYKFEGDDVASQESF